jgi:hypothetical protein
MNPLAVALFAAAAFVLYLGFSRKLPDVWAAMQGHGKSHQ